MTSVVYHAFSQKEAKELDVQHSGAQRAEAFVRAFLKRSMPRMSQQALEDHLQRKAVVLEYFTHRKQKEKRKKSKGLSAKQRRELRLFDIKPEQQRYSLFLPLHELWKQYIRDLCNGLKPDTQPQMIQAKLLKADLHGAIVSVTKSKCPSYVGVTGILLQETKHVFKIITKEDRLKVIPKLNCVFTVEIDGFISYIYGSKFQLRSSERSAGEPGRPLVRPPPLPSPAPARGGRSSRSSSGSRMVSAAAPQPRPVAPGPRPGPGAGRPLRPRTLT